MKQLHPDPDRRHGLPERTAVLLVNLGTPDAPTPKAVRRYLAEFLSDPRVIELPRWLWLPLLYGVILPFRARRSAHAYQAIWTARGSPLSFFTADLAEAVGAQIPRSVDVAWAMRYGTPSIPDVLAQLAADGALRRLLVLPLYPQYSATTTASVADAVHAELGRWRWPPEVRVVGDYWQEPGWLDAIAERIRLHWREHGRGERLLFSFHGIPRRCLLEGDPYFCHCQGSARRIAERLGLSDGEWQVTFQSRVGREEWLRPYTDETLKELAAGGVRRVDVVCPGFAVDCLETLEEIAMQNRDAFIAAGGNELTYVPALNADTSHAKALSAVIARHAQGWPEFGSLDRHTPGDGGIERNDASPATAPANDPAQRASDVRAAYDAFLSSHPEWRI
jgi:ferrochelatase